MAPRSLRVLSSRMFVTFYAIDLNSGFGKEFEVTGHQV